MNRIPRKESVRLQANQKYDSMTSMLGTAVFLILGCARYRLLRVASVGGWLQSPILLKQICFFYDTLGNPIGYITWAYLSADVEQRFVADPDFLLHFSEWNEGERLWIIDFVAPNGMVREIVDYIRRHLFSEFSEARYVRRDASGKVRKVCVWPHATNRMIG
ncbi:toxin-activating lysine-acyltransferase [Massilia pseudoviolaceinigra]|uniref:toxin-activating lysine-acyltransferase n=1 Tax=Massilia pseudoviolaceinigra TaxID=3057165 RepID=UPI00279680AD|nr:toxin-activating lysine-acyltransferase [Massilia sp. CCM 9206]MDQ1920917.1 toxin-activating lysine-acyltransferase [Massilia sp. CCM 9206]